MENLVNILVVDDKAQNLEKARKEFSGKNVELTCCNSFDLISDLIKIKKFDIVLTDLMMPGEKKGISKENPEIGKEVPYGLVISIMAKNAGVPYVAIMTDISHHAGPIAWSMDQILGKREFISGFSNKNYLETATLYMQIEDSIQSEGFKIRLPKLMIAGINDLYKIDLQKQLQEEFEIYLIPERNDVIRQFVKSKPDFVLLIGELGEKSKQEATKFYIGDIYERITSISNPEQKIFVSGWLPNQMENYIQLPFDGHTLSTKLKSL